MTTIVCKKLAKMGTHMNPRKSKICLSNVEINCNVNKTYKIFRPLHEGMSNFFLTSFNFTYFFSYFISNFRLHPPKLTGLIQFWDWIGLGPQDPKLFWGRLGPQGPKCYFGVRGWSRFWVGQGPKLGRVTRWVDLSHRLNPKIHLRNQNEPKFWGRFKLGLQDPNLGQGWPLGSNIKHTLRRHIYSCF